MINCDTQEMWHSACIRGTAVSIHPASSVQKSSGSVAFTVKNTTV